MPSVRTASDRERPGTMSLLGHWKRSTFHNGEVDPESLPPDVSIDRGLRLLILS